MADQPALFPFEVEPAGSGVRIRHSIEVPGWAAEFTRLTLKPLSQRLLDNEVRRLLELAERRRT